MIEDITCLIDMNRLSKDVPFQLTNAWISGYYQSFERDPPLNFALNLIFWVKNEKLIKSGISSSFIILDFSI